MWSPGRNNRGTVTMRRFRYSIASLIGLVIFAAISAASLRASTDAWDSWIFAGTLFVLTSSVLLSAHSYGSTRTFWPGFAVFGWAYLVATLVPSVATRLPTSMGLTRIAMISAPSRAAGMLFLDYDDDGRLDLLVADDRQQLRTWIASGPASPDRFVEIGHSLITLVFAFMGGHLSRIVAERKSSRSQIRNSDAV